jgi:hypothetical protein
MKIEISRQVMGGLMPQRSMLNASVDELEGQTFLLEDYVAPRPGSNVPKDMSNPDDANNGQVRLRFKNNKTHKGLVLTSRQLLFLHGVDANTMAKFNKLTDKEQEGEPLHETLIEKNKANAGKAGAIGEMLALPTKMTVVNVKEVMKQDPNKVDGTMTTVFPTYMYEKFDAAAKNLTDEKRIELYRDFDLINSLPGTPTATRFGTPNTVKEIKVNFTI